MKKLSYEVRVGAIALVTIAAFIWLFTFLKGENVFSNTDKYTILYSNIAGLEESSPVEVNGYKAGIVHHIHLVNDGSGLIAVQISILKDFNIPDGSIAEITTASLIAGMKIRMVLSDNKSFYSTGDTLPGRVAVSILDKVETQFEPVLGKIDSLIAGLNSTITGINNLLSPKFISDIKASGSNLSSTSEGLSKMFKGPDATIPSLVESLDSFALVLRRNSSNIDRSIQNLASVSDSIAASDISGAIKSLKENLDQTSKMLADLNNGTGTAGKILKDDSLYINLSNSLKSLDFLLTDLQQNPGNYVQFSVFGKKQKK